MIVLESLQPFTGRTSKNKVEKILLFASGLPKEMVEKILLCLDFVQKKYSVYICRSTAVQHKQLAFAHAISQRTMIMRMILMLHCEFAYRVQCALRHSRSVSVESSPLVLYGYTLPEW
jgi:hypothetical protein